jgi:hypothetical protein
VFFCSAKRLFFTHFAIFAKERRDRGKTNEHVNDTFKHAARNAAKECMNKVPVKESNQSPVERANPHKYPCDLVNAAPSFAHHRRRIKEIMFLPKAYMSFYCLFVSCGQIENEHGVLRYNAFISMEYIVYEHGKSRKKAGT